MMGRYDTIGIDCVAMNVNDLICVGARPISLVDTSPWKMRNQMYSTKLPKGLEQGAKAAGVSVSGGEIAHLRDMIKGRDEGISFDLAATVIGQVDLDKIIIGQESNMVMSLLGLKVLEFIAMASLSLVRYFSKTTIMKIHAEFQNINCTLGEELLKPTYIYVKEVLDLLSYDLRVKALVHVTSYGFFNLARVESNVGFVIDNLPTIPPIFPLSCGLEMFLGARCSLCTTWELDFV